MIKPEQIPDEAVEAAAYFLPGYHPTRLHNYVRTAIAAAINAWPNACRIEFDDWVEMVEGEIVLPAPQEGK